MPDEKDPPKSALTDQPSTGIVPASPPTPFALPVQQVPTGGTPQAVNIAFGSMPPGVGLLQALGPDLQKQLLTDNASYANRWFALQEKQLDNAHQADERAKGREHSKWWFYAIFLGVFVLIAIAGIVALYIAGKDVTAEKLLWSLFSLASGVALGWGAKTRSLSHGGGETSS